MTMTMYDYLMLKEHDQVMALASRAKFVSAFEDSTTKFCLYSLSIFFIELQQDKQTKKMIARNIFQSGTQLEKYLPKSYSLI